MQILRILLMAIGVAFFSYTFIIVRTYGLNPVPAFVGDIVAQIWSGQMHLNMLFESILAAVWVMWRHRFSPAGVLAAGVTVFAGTAFLVPYLLTLSFSTRGDALSLIIGTERARQLSEPHPERPTEDSRAETK